MNNVFLVNTKHLFALTYNGKFIIMKILLFNKKDKSVLENHHVASIFKVIKENDNCNIFANFTNENVLRMRKKMVIKNIINLFIY